MARTPNPDIERMTKHVLFALPPSLFTEFEKRCKGRYKTISEGLRELIVKYVLESK